MLVYLLLSKYINMLQLKIDFCVCAVVVILENRADTRKPVNVPVYHVNTET